MREWLFSKSFPCWKILLRKNSLDKCFSLRWEPSHSHVFLFFVFNLFPNCYNLITNLCDLHHVTIDCVSTGHICIFESVMQFQPHVYVLTLVKDNHGIEHLLHSVLVEYMRDQMILYSIRKHLLDVYFFLVVNCQSLQICRCSHYILDKISEIILF